MSEFNYEKDADGIVTITMDMAGPVNTMNAKYRELMTGSLEKLENEKDLKGVVITSGKETFFAGGDLKELYGIQKGEEQALLDMIENLKGPLRRLEKLPVPVVAAINGAALGGGFEICLACNYRVIANKSSALVGLPEVTLGLLPGAGGVVRMINIIGFEKAMPYLLEGKKLKPAEAIEAGLVNELVEDEADLVVRAKVWIKGNQGQHQQPWDIKGHKIPGGNVNHPRVIQGLQIAPAMLYKKTRGLMPAPERILAVAADALRLDFDTAFRIESRGLAYLVTTPEAKNIINSLFFQLNGINSGWSRPKAPEKSKVRKVGILGAGMMGQGIAYVSAMVGIEAVLKDISQEAAEKGKAYSEKLLAKRVAKGRMTEEQKEDVLGLIKPTAKNEDLEGCDLIVEAVFENIGLKAKVTAETEPFLAENGIYSSNTSTLPITQLAEASEKPENFIGIHFFSPVDKMPLVEIIAGEKTSDETLARAFDYARQIKKTPIVVNDSLGFFTSRVFGTFMDEGTRLLEEGLSPILIDRMGQQVGMPVGPLTVQDEVSLELVRKGAETHREMGVYGSKYDVDSATRVAELMIQEFRRGGRYHGGGFYEYPADGDKQVWSELKELFYKEHVSLPEQDIKDRILFRQIIESVKCLQEGVLRSVADGNIGSIFGIGAPVHTGGFLQFINTYGVQRFVDRAKELASLYGDRFEPPALLLEKANSGESF